MPETSDPNSEGGPGREWCEAELLGHGEDCYVNVRLDLPRQVAAGVTVTKVTGERPDGGPTFKADIVWESPAGETSDGMCVYRLSADGEDDAEVFRELAEVATEAAEYLESSP